MTAATLAFIQSKPAFSQAFALLPVAKGIADASAIALLGELLLLPAGLSHPQWVKFAGLDPSHFRSGTRVDRKARISKAGNHYIRAALYMPALSAKTLDPYVKTLFEHLIATAKTPMQAFCAAMLKRLHALHGMLTNNPPSITRAFMQVLSKLMPLQRKYRLLLNSVTTWLGLCR